MPKQPENSRRLQPTDIRPAPQPQGRTIGPEQTAECGIDRERLRPWVGWRTYVEVQGPVEHLRHRCAPCPEDG